MVLRTQPTTGASFTGLLEPALLHFGPRTPTLNAAGVLSAAPDGWVTQPIATIIAGLLAIIAALIALVGVRITQQTTMRSTRLQLEAAAKLDRDKHDRDVLFAVLTDVLSSVVTSHTAVLRVGNAGNPESWLLARDALTASAATAVKLLLVDRPEPYADVMTFVEYCRYLLEDETLPWVEEGELEHQLLAATDALKKARLA